MTGLGMKLPQTQRLFFDRAAVLKAVSRAERRTLSRFGAFVRRTARSSIRRRKRISAPGAAPSSHTGLLRRTIFFAYEPRRSSVVIGPLQLNKGTDAPALLEQGGRITRRRRNRRVRLAYRPRPFMGPAFQREQSRLPALWRNSVR